MYILIFLSFQQEVHCVMAGIETAAVLKHFRKIGPLGRKDEIKIQYWPAYQAHVEFQNTQKIHISYRPVQQYFKARTQYILFSGVTKRLSFFSETTLENRNCHMEQVIISQWLRLAFSEETKGSSTRTTAMISVFHFLSSSLD